MIVQLPNGRNSARVSFKTVKRKQSYARKLSLSINGFAITHLGWGRESKTECSSAVLCCVFRNLTKRAPRNATEVTEVQEEDKSVMIRERLNSLRFSPVIYIVTVCGFLEFDTKIEWWRGGELNSLRRPFQGRALPVSYPATEAVKDSMGAPQGCQCSRDWRSGVES
jgi:hypothetical protein